MEMIRVNAMDRRRILLIDQQPYYRSFVRREIELEGLDVDVEANYENVDLNNIGSYDAVILGCQSIGRGEENYIRQVSQSRTPIFIWAAEGNDPACIRAAMLNGAKDITLKPLGRTSLKRSIQELIK